MLDNIYEGAKDALIWNSNSDGVLRIDRIYAMYLLTAYQPLEYKLPSEVDKVRKDKSTTPFEFVSFGEKNNLVELHTNEFELGDYQTTYNLEINEKKERFDEWYNDDYFYRYTIKKI